MVASELQQFHAQILIKKCLSARGWPSERSSSRVWARRGYRQSHTELVLPVLAPSDSDTNRWLSARSSRASPLRPSLHAADRLAKPSARAAGIARAARRRRAGSWSAPAWRRPAEDCAMVLPKSTQRESTILRATLAHVQLFEHTDINDEPWARMRQTTADAASGPVRKSNTTHA